MPETAPAIPKASTTGGIAGVTSPVNPTPLPIDKLPASNVIIDEPPKVNPYPFEPGRNTSEYQGLLGLFATFLTAVLGVLANFGHTLTGGQQAAIVSVLGSGLALASGLYSIGRSIRKAGLTK